MTFRREHLPILAGSWEGEPRGPIPWEDPDLPKLTGFFRTLRLLLFSPDKFFRTPHRGGWQEALAFGLIVGAAGFLASIYWQFLLQTGIARMVEAASGVSRSFSLGTGAVIALMVAAPILTLANLGLNGVCLWGAVRLVGAEADFLPIWRITGYAQGAMAAALVPILGAPAAALGWLYLNYKGIKIVFGLTSGRAILALALFLALEGLLLLFLLGGLVGLMGFLGFWVLWSLG